ncbi:hypothetical protein FGG78_07785 [Thioclava sp. BHET1]|nr:hypothetical protein FGG78_07785 [Thioclava sp. BHET1]
MATQKPELRKRLEGQNGAQKRARFYVASVDVMEALARACRHDSHSGLAPRDITKWTCGEADPRFEGGRAVPKQDHADLDRVLDDFTRSANRLIKLSALDEAQARDEAGQVYDTVATIEAFLKRHQTDEEELAVPIILHHRLRG